MLLQLVNTIAIVLIAVLAVMSIGVSYWHARSKQVTQREWLFDWISGFSTEMAGALLTAVLFGLIVGAAQQGQNDQDLRQELIRQLGSQVHDITVRAAEELEARGWILDGSLRNAHLNRANLQEVGLAGVNLQGVEFNEANLQGAFLLQANLQGASLRYANLKGAWLGITNLKGASLRGANLQGAEFTHANLQGADLQYASLNETVFNDRTILPDGSRWTPETDMSRFTDPNNPNFWRSSDPSSPAYSENALIPTLTP